MATPRVHKKPRIRNPALTRARLLNATVEILAQKGAEGLSLKEAATLAEVSRGAAYQHFKDRDHLLREAKGWVTERLLEAVLKVDPDQPLAQTVEIARLVLHHHDALTLLMTDALAGRDLGPDHPLTQLVRQSLERLKQSGKARPDIDVDVLSYMFLSMVGTLIILSRLPGMDKDELAQRYMRELVAFMRHGIFKDPESALLPD